MSDVGIHAGPAEIDVRLHVSGATVYSARLVNVDPYDFEAAKPGDEIRFRVEAIERREWVTR